MEPELKRTKVTDYKRSEARTEEEKVTGYKRSEARTEKDRRMDGMVTDADP